MKWLNLSPKLELSLFSFKDKATIFVCVIPHNKVM